LNEADYDERQASGRQRRKSSFARDVFKLASGAAFAQLLSMLATPILTRLYAPDAFGILAVFLSIIAVPGEIACLGYDRAIVLPEKDEEAANLLVTSLGFVALVTGLSIVVIWLGTGTITRLLRAPELAPYMWLVPPSILLTGVFTALSQWTTRSKRFGQLSIARISNTTITTGMPLGAGLLGYATSLSLIVGYTFGTLAATLWLALRVLRSDTGLFRHDLHKQDILSGVKRYRKFPLYDTWATLLNSISWQLPTFFLAAFFSPAVAGFYALGNRVLRLPMNLLGSSLGQVFYQRAAKDNQQGILLVFVESTFSRLVSFGMFPMLVLNIIGRDLFTVVFGNQWAEAGTYTQILSIWTFFWFVSSPLSTLYYVLEKQDLLLKLNVAIIVTRVVSLGIGGILGDARLALVLFAVSGIVVYGYLGLVVVAASGVPWKRIFTILGFHFLLFVPTGIVLIALNVAHVSRAIELIAAFVFSGMYFVYIFINDPEIKHAFR